MLEETTLQAPCAPLPRFSLFPPLSFSPLFLSSFPLSLFPSSLSSLHLNQLKCSLVLINVTPLLGDEWNIYLGVWGLSPFCPLLKAWVWSVCSSNIEWEKYSFLGTILGPWASAGNKQNSLMSLWRSDASRHRQTTNSKHGSYIRYKRGVLWSRTHYLVPQGWPISAMEERKHGAGFTGCTQQDEGRPQRLTLSKTPHTLI